MQRCRYAVDQARKDPEQHRAGQHCASAGRRNAADQPQNPDQRGGNEWPGIAVPLDHRKRPRHDLHQHGMSKHHGGTSDELRPIGAQTRQHCPRRHDRDGSQIGGKHHGSIGFGGSGGGGGEGGGAGVGGGIEAIDLLLAQNLVTDCITFAPDLPLARCGDALGLACADLFEGLF